MPARERLNPVEQYLAYLIGLGIALAIIAAMLIGFGGVRSTSTTVMLVVGLALAAIGIAAWLVFVRPWTQFDDLRTPHFTGHDEHEARALSPEAAWDAAIPAPPAEPETAAEALLGDAVPARPATPPVDTLETELDSALATEEDAALETQLDAALDAGHAAPPVEMVPTPATTERDDLLAIDGLGPKSQEVLFAAGARSLKPRRRRWRRSFEALGCGWCAPKHGLSKPRCWPPETCPASRPCASRCAAGGGPRGCYALRGLDPQAPHPSVLRTAFLPPKRGKEKTRAVSPSLILGLLITHKYGEGIG